MKSKWITGIAILSLAITLLTFHVYIDGEPQPVMEAFYGLIDDSGGSDIWSCTDSLTGLTDSSGRYENPVWSPDGISIAFERDGWIYVADAKHGDACQLVEGFDPAFSPANDEVLFVRPIEPDSKHPEYRVNGIEVLTVDRQGTNVQCIAKLENIAISRQGKSKPYNDYLVWSPSKRMAVLNVHLDTQPDFATARLAIWNVQSGDLKYIDSATPFWPPSWSPDEQQLVCASIPYDEFGETSNAKPDLWCINTNTCQLTRLTATPDIAEDSPIWSPDGSKIAFGSYDYGSARGFMSNGLERGGDICTIKPDGTTRKVLVNRSVPWMMMYQNEDILAWCPDGSAVAYFAWGLRAGSETVELSQELWQIGGVMHEPSGHLSAEKWDPLVRASLRDGFLGDISWSPRGDKIAFEWTPCEIIANANSTWGVHLQINDHSSLNQLIYVLEVPKGPSNNSLEPTCRALPN